jgi:SPP1 gp7 family putative phage head morphogenesis protein
MKLLPPMILKPGYYEGIEKEIMKFFHDQIYRPLFLAAQISDDELKNAKDSLADAVRKGTVDFDGGEKFTGQFNATISKQLKDLGARYDARTKTWILNRDRVPVSVSLAKANADFMFEKLRKAVLRTLDDSTIDSIFAHNFHASFLQEKYEKAIEWMNQDFQKTVQSITIIPVLNPAQKKNIAESWTNNLKLYIRGWTRDNTVELRKKIEKNAYSGQRAANMVKLIQDNYGVAKSKAQFLARQETSLLMSKFTEERYKDVGVQKYKWYSSLDQRVRDDHKHLDGKTFFFSSPPVVDKRTGRRGNPGEDFNCRCVARAVWE